MTQHRDGNPARSKATSDERGHDLSLSGRASQPIERERKAAEQGEAAAQDSLGDVYRDGYAVDQDLAQAATWYRKAAEQADASAQKSLGDLLFAFLTTEPNAIIAPIHAKAMPVILTTPEEVDAWLTLSRLGGRERCAAGMTAICADLPLTTLSGHAGIAENDRSGRGVVVAL
jgi:hypothetical protein